MKKCDITLIFPRSQFLINDGVFPPLGIMYLSAYLKDSRYRVQCLDFGLGHTVDDIESDVVGISFTTPQRKEAYEIVSKCKDDKYLIAGGPHPTHMPKECFDNGFDAVVTGYGEEKLTDLMDTIYKREGGVERKRKSNIDEYPFPDRNALPIKEYEYYIDDEPATVIMTSRGCCYDCSFCARIDKTFRQQSANRTVSEIFGVNNDFGFKAFMIFDDTFILNKERLSHIANGVNGSGFKFRCFGRSNLITDAICQELRRMNVVEVGIGVESGADVILRKNMKGTTRSVNTEAIRLLHEYGIRAKAFLIVGLPGETTSTILETESWIKEAEPDDVDISILQPLPGSAIFENPDYFGLKFNYNGDSMWYKGTPGKYKATSRTESLDETEIVHFRDYLEHTYKSKELLR